MPNYVVSSTLSDPGWNNTQVIAVGDVERLKSEVDGDILVNGSVRLVNALLDAGLVDELRLMVFPLVLGKGKRLFGAVEKTPLELVEARPVGSEGVSVQVYTRS